MALEFQSKWKKFQEVVLLNKKSLELIVAYRGTKNQSAEISTILEQNMAEQIRGKEWGIDTAGEAVSSAMETALKAQEVQNFLNLHLNGFLTQLGQSISKEEAHYLYRYYKSKLVSYYSEKNHHLTGATWAQAFYGSTSKKTGKINLNRYYRGQGLGQAYDAFMNHMANYERGIYNYLKTSGMEQINLNSINKDTISVYEQEGGIKGHFPQLLIDSKNHIGWYTGGDIIIVDPKTMQVVYNIQLKTTGKKTKSLFKERIQSLRIVINSLKSQDADTQARILFKQFKTEISNFNEFDDLIQEDIDNLVETAMGKHIRNLTK